MGKLLGLHLWLVATLVHCQIDTDKSISSTALPKKDQSSTTTVPSTTTTTSSSSNNLVDKPGSSQPFADYRFAGEYCSCDLTQGQCDINCCCDQECSKLDQSLFSDCTQTRQSRFIDTKYCYSRNTIYTINSKQELVQVASGLFCIAWDNVMRRDEYRDRRIVTTAAEAQQLRPRNPYGWQVPHSHLQSKRPPMTKPPSKSLRHGSNIRIEIKGLKPMAWRLPTGIVDGDCDSLRRVRFLVSFSSSCVRRIVDLSTECSSNKFLSASAYHQNLFVSKRQPSDELIDRDDNGPMGRAGPVTMGIEREDIQQPSLGSGGQRAKLQMAQTKPTWTCSDCVPIQATNGSDSSGFEPPVASKLDDMKIHCRNVVRSVRYQVLYDPQEGITNVTALFEFDGLTQATTGPLTFRQTFQVQFFNTNISTGTDSRRSSLSMLGGDAVSLWLGDSDDELTSIFERSGNPGYLRGRPVLATNITQAGENSTGSRYHQLTLPRGRPGDGHCPTTLIDQRLASEPIRFGVNMFSGCMLNVNALSTRNSVRDLCHEVQFAINNLLDVDSPLDYVAAFGNSNLSAKLSAGEWVKLLVEDSPAVDLVHSISSKTPNGKCPLLVTGYSISLYYAYVGPEREPQAKIIAAIKRYHKSEYLTVECRGPFCNPAVGSLIQLSTSVSFFDMTRPARPQYAPPPVFKLQLPADFFYPFFIGAGGSSSSPLRHQPGRLGSALIIITTALFAHPLLVHF